MATNLFTNGSKVTASSEYYAGSRAVDGVLIDDNGHDWISNNSMPCNIVYDLESSPAKINHLRIYVNVTPAIHNFTFEGSNDNSTWTTLYTNTASLPGGTFGVEANHYDFYFPNPTAYRYYKVNITSTDRGHNYSGFVELMGFVEDVTVNNVGFLALL